MASIFILILLEENFERQTCESRTSLPTRRTCSCTQLCI